MAREQRIEERSAPQAGESSGVENLIDRLRDQGIEQGHTQAEALVTAAQQKAADIVARANREAETIRVTAKEEAGKLKAAGEDAIRLAMRDTTLSLESGLINVFENSLGRLVKGTLADPTFLQRMILEIAGKASAATSGEPMQMLLPAEIVSLDDLRRKPEEVKRGTLTHFVLSLGEGMLREGVSFGVAEDGTAGIRVKLVDGNMQVNLTESALTELLLRHMVPRFRALLRGAVVPESGPAKPNRGKRRP